MHFVVRLLYRILFAQLCIKAAQFLWNSLVFLRAIVYNILMFDLIVFLWGGYMKKKTLYPFLAAILVLSVCFAFYLFTYHSAQKTATQTYLQRETVVVIDAGHGGEDGGAVATDGTAEQIINLQIARLLEQQLRAFGVQTVMTRTTEDSIHDPSAKTIRERKVSDIHNRMAIMEKTENCLFVSIHQNKYADRSLWGTQVFYSPNTTASALLADSVQSAVISILQPENKRDIKKSNSSIYLLYYAKKPAILVECGFISNPSETEKLKTVQYQKQMAFSIAVGVLNYLKA